MSLSKKEQADWSRRYQRFALKFMKGKKHSETILVECYEAFMKKHNLEP